MNTEEELEEEKEEDESFQLKEQFQQQEDKDVDDQELVNKMAIKHGDNFSNNPIEALKNLLGIRKNEQIKNLGYEPNVICTHSLQLHLCHHSD